MVYKWDTPKSTISPNKSKVFNRYDYPDKRLLPKIMPKNPYASHLWVITLEFPQTSSENTFIRNTHRWCSRWRLCRGPVPPGALSRCGLRGPGVTSRARATGQYKQWRVEGCRSCSVVSRKGRLGHGCEAPRTLSLYCWGFINCFSNSSSIVIAHIRIWPITILELLLKQFGARSNSEQI